MKKSQFSVRKGMINFKIREENLVERCKDPLIKNLIINHDNVMHELTASKDAVTGSFRTF